MNFPMKPDSTVVEEKTRIGRVPTLVVRPARRPLSPFGLLWIHGGGYITGMKEMVYMSCGADFARDFGMTVFSPGYRLAWLHTEAFPHRKALPVPRRYSRGAGSGSPSAERGRHRGIRPFSRSRADRPAMPGGFSGCSRPVRDCPGSSLYPDG